MASRTFNASSFYLGGNLRPIRIIMSMFKV